MPRLALRGPGTNNWQVSLFKNFVVKELLRFQLRTEAHNVFNHTQFSSVNTGLAVQRGAPADRGVGGPDKVGQES